MANLTAKYTFVSPTTNNTYSLEVETGPLTNPIATLDNPDCIGWTILSGTFVTTINGVNTSYNVPSGATPFIYNGLWQSAGSSPDGNPQYDGSPNCPWCKGIDRLFIAANPSSSNTIIYAIDEKTMGINLEGIVEDKATLESSQFPPQ